MRTPTNILMSGPGDDLQERRVAMLAIEVKRSVTQEFLDIANKELAETRAILTGDGPADYVTPVSELARKLVSKCSAAITFYQANH